MKQLICTLSWQSVVSFRSLSGVFLLLSLAIAPLHADTYQVTDSFGKHNFETVPQRVVVTDWTLLEQLLELGITPVGAPELTAYHKLVKQPALPETIVDIGLRRSPNIAQIKQLKPDLIILGTDQKEFDRPFSRIARVVYYQNFSKRFASNGETSKKRFLQLAELFQKQAFARNKLTLLEQQFTQYAAQTRLYFGDKMPQVMLLRLLPNNNVIAYGNHSMPGYVLQQLGLENALQLAPNQLGERQMKLHQLAELPADYLLYWANSDSENILTNTQWQQLPLVTAGKAIPLKTAWSYGGAMSLLYNARAITQALLDQ